MQRGEAAVKKGGGVRCGEVFLPDSPFPFADSQGRGAGERQIADFQGEGGRVGTSLQPINPPAMHTVVDMQAYLC